MQRLKTSDGNVITERTYQNIYDTYRRLRTAAEGNPERQDLIDGIFDRITANRDKIRGTGGLVTPEEWDRLRLTNGEDSRNYKRFPKRSRKKKN